MNIDEELARIDKDRAEMRERTKAYSPRLEVLRTVASIALSVTIIVGGGIALALLLLPPRNPRSIEVIVHFDPPLVVKVEPQ